jgi:hypothetical protein
MDAADVFRQGLGSMLPRPSPYFFPGRPPVPVPTPYPWDSPDNENEAPHRIAHTLTACCRCRQVSRPFFRGALRCRCLCSPGPSTQLPESIHPCMCSNSRLEEDEMRSHPPAVSPLRTVGLDLRVLRQHQGKAN